MATVLSPPEAATQNRIVLRNISWETYERLLDDLSDNSVPHLTYDHGALEIMSPTAKHENINRALDLLISLLAEEFETEARGLGSTTFRREDLERGFEPDSCFYSKNESLIRGKDRLDLAVDPPPDLVIEIDITSSSLNKSAIFAEFGVPEVWRYDGENVHILLLDGEVYVESEESSVIPFVTAAVLTQFIADSLSLGPLEWIKKVRNWARLRKRA